MYKLFSCMLTKVDQECWSSTKRLCLCCCVMSVFVMDIFWKCLKKIKVKKKKHSWLDNYSAGSQSADRHVSSLGHIYLIPSQPVFVISPLCWVLSGEAANTNFIVFGLTRQQLKHKKNLIIWPWKDNLTLN
jgi:hypothetical protein